MSREPPPPAPRRLSTLRGLAPFLRPYRAQVALAFVLLCLGSVTILVVPLAFRDLVDSGFGKGVAAGGGLLGTASLDGHFLALFGLGCEHIFTLSGNHIMSLFDAALETRLDLACAP